MKPKTPRKIADLTRLIAKGKIAMAVLAIVGTDPGTYDDVDDHPGSLDLPKFKQNRSPTKITNGRNLVRN